MNNRWLRLAGWVLAVAVAVFAVREVMRQWHALVTQPVIWHVRPLYIVAAVALVLLNYVVLVHWSPASGNMCRARSGRWPGWP